MTRRALEARAQEHRGTGCAPGCDMATETTKRVTMEKRRRKTIINMTIKEVSRQRLESVAAVSLHLRNDVQPEL